MLPVFTLFFVAIHERKRDLPKELDLALCAVTLLLSHQGARHHDESHAGHKSFTSRGGRRLPHTLHTCVLFGELAAASPVVVGLMRALPPLYVDDRAGDADGDTFMALWGGATHILQSTTLTSAFVT